MAKVHSSMIFTVAMLVAANVSGAETIVADGGSAKTLDRSFPFSANGTIDVGNIRGNVTLTGGGEEDIKLGGSLGADSRLVVEGDAQRLRLRVESAKSSSWFGSDGPRSDTDLVLGVPHGASVKLDLVSAGGKIGNIDGKSIEVNTVSGDVRIEGAARGVEIDSVSGDVTLRATRPGATERVHVQTVSGDIQIDGADGRVKLETVSGKIAFAAPQVGEFEAESVSADIEGNFAPTKGAHIRAETMSGKLRLHLPADLAARIHAETFSGNLKTDYGKVIKTEFGPGSHLDVDDAGSDTRINAQSFSGNVELRKQ